MIFKSPFLTVFFLPSKFFAAAEIPPGLEEIVEEDPDHEGEEVWRGCLTYGCL